MRVKKLKLVQTFGALLVFLSVFLCFGASSVLAEEAVVLFVENPMTWGIYREETESYDFVRPTVSIASATVNRKKELSNTHGHSYTQTVIVPDLPNRVVYNETSGGNGKTLGISSVTYPQQSKRLSSETESDGTKKYEYYDKWTPGKEIRMTVQIENLPDGVGKNDIYVCLDPVHRSAYDDAEAYKTYSYVFSKVDINSVTADYVPIRVGDIKKSGNRATVVLYYTPVTTLGKVECAGWDQTYTKARWSSVLYASSYRVTLLEDDREVDTIYVNTNEVDFSGYMTAGHTYSYEVAAVPNGKEERKYLTWDEENTVRASNQVISVDVVEQKGAADTAETGKNLSGGKWKYYREGGRYELSDGSDYTTPGWVQIENIWYYFGENGYTCRGTQVIDQKTYVFDDLGRWQGESAS